MKEDFLHCLWKLKKFDTANLKTHTGETIIIIHSGQYLQLAGPDFFNAQLIIGEQKWAGNIEIHLKSSDWYLHRHEEDTAYDNVILHVVWEHDAEVFRADNSEIPVLELKNYTSSETIANYKSLVSAKSWIYCERQLASIDSFIIGNWLERLFFERLEKKFEPIATLLSENSNDWEATLFCLLAKNFGLNTNGEAFFQMAESIPFDIIRKESSELENLEALFFGRLKLLDEEKEDVYFKYLKSSSDFLNYKYGLPDCHIQPVQFFKHRPDNFPTIRIAQLAQLYHTSKHLFADILEADSIASYYNLFRVDVSGYWQSHYQFDKTSPKKRKPLTKSFIDLLLINTIIPLRFAYAKSVGKDNSETLIGFAINIPPEKNNITDKFTVFGIKAKNAFETQALLQLKNDYCNKSRCLECAIGIELLNPPENFVHLTTK